MRQVHYYSIGRYNGFHFYKELLGDKYSVEFREEGRYVSVHFYFDNEGNPIIDNVYKKMTNYKAPQYLRKYRENKELYKAMMIVKAKREW